MYVSVSNFKKELKAANNRIAKLPTEIGNCTLLETVGVSAISSVLIFQLFQNQLNSLPDELSNCRNLKNLNVTIPVVLLNIADSVESHYFLTIVFSRLLFPQFAGKLVAYTFSYFRLIQLYVASMLTKIPVA